MENITLNAQDVLNMMQMLTESVKKGVVNEPAKPKLSGLSVYLLNKIGYDNLNMEDGTPIQKSVVDDVTLDFTRGRTLSEEEAEIQLNFIFDKSPYLRMFNSRIVNKLVTPIQATAITSENLISNEQLGSAVSVINKRIVHNFGINLYLRHVQLQTDIPLQTVIDNLYNPGWEANTINNVAIALANDIYRLVINGIGGSYAGTGDFYDLQKGFIKILQEANGKATNTYGTITVTGFLGKHLTPQKFDTTSYIGGNYTAANLLIVMRKMYQLMPIEYRSNPRNVWMMSQQDFDLYTESRSDMAVPSNTTREQNLTNGITPNFMGHNVIAMPEMVGIDEAHKADSSFYGSIVFGDPKNIDVASDKSTYLKTMDFNARGSTGPVFEYTYDMYLDIQVARCESFVIALKGAKCETPVLIDTALYQNGNTGELASATLATPWKFRLYCDTKDAVIYWSTTDTYVPLDAPDTDAPGDAAVYVEGAEFTLTATTYFRAYKDGLIASDLVTVTKGE